MPSAEYQKEWKKRNKEKLKKYRDTYYYKHREERNSQSKEYYKKNTPTFIPLTEEEKKRRKEKAHKKHYKYIKKHKSSVCISKKLSNKVYYKMNKEAIDTRVKSNRVEATSGYIMTLIKTGRDIDNNDISPEFIEFYRAILLLKRTIKQLKEKKNEQSKSRESQELRGSNESNSPDCCRCYQ